MAIDPVAAALDAIAAHLASEVGDLGAARRGWPEHRQDLDFTDGAIVTVSGPDLPRTAVSPKQVDSSGTPTVSVTYRTALREGPIQIDLWARYRSQRDDLVPLIEAALSPDMPYYNGLRLLSTGYYSRPISLTVRRTRTWDDGGGAQVGEWRYTWECDLLTDEVQVVTHPVATQLDVELTSSVQDEDDAAAHETETTTYTP